MAYLERGKARELEAYFDTVEAARVGTLAAFDKDTNRAWQQYRQAHTETVAAPRGLTGAALEQAVLGIGLASPEYVVIKTGGNGTAAAAAS